MSSQNCYDMHTDQTSHCGLALWTPWVALIWKMEEICSSHSNTFLMSILSRHCPSCM